MQAQAPVIKKAIPTQVVNEGAAYGPFDLKNFIQVPDDGGLTPAAEGLASGEGLKFQGELVDGRALPVGLICTQDGFLTGIPGKGTEGNYEVVITATNEAGSVTAQFSFIIKPSMTETGTEYLSKIKSQIWEALEQNLPIPDLAEMYELPISPLEIYYLLERWGVLTIWDAFNLDTPGPKVPLDLKGVSPHYQVYDCGSCLIASPKDLYSHERTIADGLMTAKAVAEEAFMREWTIEVVGISKLRRAFWVEIQHLNDKFGKQIDIINYQPSPDDMLLYTTQVKARKPAME